jgi:hypothetical protein
VLARIIRFRLRLLPPLILLGAIALTAIALRGEAAAGESESASAELRAAFAEFGFSEEQRRTVENGRIETIDGESAQPTELTSAVAARLPVAIARFADRLRDGIPITADPHLRAYARIDGGTTLDPWRDTVFGERERAEAMRLFRLEPGLAFNLSAAEIRGIRDALRGRQAAVGDALTAASDAYRTVLIGRFRAYRLRGLDGLAEYDRGEGEVSFPALQARRVGAMARAPARLAPLVTMLARFPRHEQGRFESRFYWKKTEIEDRPAFVLSHVVLEERPEAVFFALREYYVGHTYNVLQQFGLVLPWREGGMLLVVNSTVTDRLDGIFGPLARAIGQRRSRDALQGYAEGLREQSLRAAEPVAGGG